MYTSEPVTLAPSTEQCQITPELIQISLWSSGTIVREPSQAITRRAVWGVRPVPSIYYIGPPNDGSEFQNGQADCSSNATRIPSKCVKGISAFLIADRRGLGLESLCA